jgi:hypothetical protein
MNKLGKTLGVAFAVLALVVAAVITFTIGWRPFIGPRTRPLTARKFQSTPERLGDAEQLTGQFRGWREHRQRLRGDNV